ncbi:MAG: glycosyltransferase family 9 protein, partial [Armatimonadetes bacterium]|nr:glycosyltransferase family 9 protein [Armatimonadota bacterium]
MRVTGARVLMHRRPRRLTRVAAADTRAVTIVSPGGLGDRLVALALAYHLAAAGLRAAAVTEAGEPADDGLPALPLLAAPTDGSTELRLRELEAFRWDRPGDMLRELLGEIGVEFGPVPAHACLQVEPWYRDAVRELVGERRYVLIAPEGHYEADAKRMSRAQVEAVAAAAWQAGRAPVIVHDKRLNADIKGVLDLSGRTSVSELCALVAHADAVVSTDTGTLHLAGAYHTPLVAVCPWTLHPTRFWHSYVPAVWLACRDAAGVAPRLVESATRRMLEAVEAQWA